MSKNEAPIAEQDVMPPKTLRALRGAIAKWKGIVAGTQGDKGTRNCSLCKQFYRNDDRLGCRGCPVRAATQRDYCLGSPHERWRQRMEAKVGYQESWRVCDEESRALAQAELDFLESLLPPGCNRTERKRAA